MNLCFCDTETTGLYVDAGHEAWEVAVLVVRGEDMVEQTWQLPVDVSKADPQSLAMNGWYRRSLQHEGVMDLSYEDRRRQGLHEHDRWAREFMALVHGCTLIGAVPSFDERFLTRALRKGGGVPCWHYQPIDVETLAAGWVLGQAEVLRDVYTDSTAIDLDVDMQCVTLAETIRTPPWDSEALSTAVGVNPDLFERHSALGDCRWAKAIWDVIMTPPIAHSGRSTRRSAADRPS